MPPTFTNVLLHTIFSTRERAPLLAEPIRAEVHAYLGGILREIRSTPIMINGTADHVHLLMTLPSDMAIAECLRLLKTNSSRWVKEKWPERRSFAWQSGYGAFSMSESRRASVIRYVQNQEKHHRKVTFKDEFLTFLRKHGVDFDERYVWK
jgi:REP element-mobilizing transposase RayT